MTKQTRDWSMVRASKVAMRTSNPIRKIVDQLDPSQMNPDKPLISLSIGDPTTFGNLETDENVIESVRQVLSASGRAAAGAAAAAAAAAEGSAGAAAAAAAAVNSNGYGHAAGFPSVRAALARHLNAELGLSGDSVAIAERDIVLASGCSGALDMVITALADEGDNILLPRPGFSLYATLCDSKGIECRYYDLCAEKNWEADLAMLERLVDARTRALLINNPSNPCGSVYSRAHLKELVALAKKHCLPIIADEIYAGMVFEGSEFVPLAQVAAREQVPVLSVGGLAKRFLVPGWRLGWIYIVDSTPGEVLNEVRQGLQRVATLILGPNTVVQAALPGILASTPRSFHQQLNATLQKQAFLSAERIQDISGLTPVRPGGAMYMMVAIDMPRFSAATNGAIHDDVSFCRALLREESVVVLPGQCFRMSNFFRIVVCPPVEQLSAAFDRMEAFCRRTLRLADGQQ